MRCLASSGMELALVLFGLAGVGLVSGMRARSSADQPTEAADEMEGLKKLSDAFAALAEDSNFALKKGIFYNFGIEDCMKLTNNGLTCYAQNPSSPYGLIMVPQPDGEQEDFSECGGQWKPICKTNEDNEIVSIPFHMNPTEAIVLIGITPPAVRYFSFQNYLFEHTYPEDFEIASNVSFASRCWPSGSSERRCETFSSMGDSVNRKRMLPFSMEGEPTRRGEDVFSKPFALVMSPSRTRFREVESLLKSSGIGEVNELPLPGEFLKLGFGEGTDTVMNLLRTAFPEDTEAYSQWLSDSQNFFVHRLTPQKELTEQGLYPKPSYCVDKQSPPEDYCLIPRSKLSEGDRMEVSMESLKDAQTLILNTIRKRVGYWTKWYTTKFAFTSGVQDSGFLCIERGQKCQGDGRDTYYPASVEMIKSHLTRGAMVSKLEQALRRRPLTLKEMAEWAPSRQDQRSTLSNSSMESMVVVGVLHSAMKASSYSSVSVYDFWKLQGIMAVEDSQLKGSADAYLAGTEYEHLSPYLYAWEFTRDRCGDKRFCTDVPSTGPLGIPLATPIVFIERMYDDPLTDVGIDGSAVVPARLIHLAK